MKVGQDINVLQSTIPEKDAKTSETPRLIQNEFDNVSISTLEHELFSGVEGNSDRGKSSSNQKSPAASAEQESNSHPVMVALHNSTMSDKAANISSAGSKP